MNGWLFDGEHEIDLRLERGSSFGLSKDQYGALAHIAMGALRMAGVEPAEIRLLADEPGADVILYSKAFVYTVRMQPLKERSALYALGLDSKLGGPGEEVCVHKFADTDYVGAILAVILHREGAAPVTAGEYLRDFPLS